MDKSLIIIGGMGPQASVRLHQQIISDSRNFHSGDPSEYPQIIHVSLPVPDFIASANNYAAALKMVQDACSSLPLNTARAIGMACNTAHLMVDDLPLANTNFVSMIDRVVSSAKHQNLTTVGLLASPHTIKTQLYQKKFEANGINVILPDAAELIQLDQLIHQVIEGRASQKHRKILNAIARRLIKAGVNSVILGCTELPIVGVDNNIPSIDSLKELSASLLEKYYERDV